MGRALWLKIAAIIGLVVALLVPLKLIESKIEERAATREGVVRELASTSVDEQSISGPLLLLPCTEHYFVEETDAKGVLRNVKRERNCSRAYAAERLAVNGTQATENRYRGIYAARFFVAKLQFEGRFELRAEAPPPAGVTRDWGQPLLLMSIRDARGIRSASALTWNSDAIPFQPGAAPGASGAGVHAPLPARGGPLSGVHTFAFSFELMGLQSLSFIPSARQHEVTLASDWAHPSFGGRHLPASREVSAAGFRATWKLSELASEAPRALAACGDPGCGQVQQHAFGVRLIDPVDVYVQTVLDSTLRALGFGGMLTGLYSMLYALLRSEDHSLLMGSILVFAVLAAVMLATRRVDWYRVGHGSATSRVAVTAE